VTLNGTPEELAAGFIKIVDEYVALKYGGSS
jgi:hypothetical protein